MTFLQTSITKAGTQEAKRKGVTHWRRQRISAIILVPLSIWFLLEILRHIQADYQTVLAWVAQPWVGTALAFFMGLIFYHSALGLQVIIEDYIPNPFWQKALIIKVKALNFIMAVLSWFLIIYIAIMGNK